MDAQTIAVALVKNTVAPRPTWLARQQSSQAPLEFILGQRLEDESFRETVFREVAWALGLDRNRDFLVSNMAQLNLELDELLPGQDTVQKTAIQFYNVEVYRKATLESIANDPRNVWVDSQEICNGVSHEGIAFDPLITYLINRSEVIQPWESQPPEA